MGFWLSAFFNIYSLNRTLAINEDNGNSWTSASDTCRDVYLSTFQFYIFTFSLHWP